MAFNKSFVDPSTHATGNHWDISGILIDPIANNTSFVLGCFVSAEAKEAGASALTQVNFNINEGQLSKDECQAIVLARSEFSDATVI